MTFSCLKKRLMLCVPPTLISKMCAFFASPSQLIFSWNLPAKMCTSFRLSVATTLINMGTEEICIVANVFTQFRYYILSVLLPLTKSRQYIFHKECSESFSFESCISTYLYAEIAHSMTYAYQIFFRKIFFLPTLCKKTLAKYLVLSITFYTEFY